MIALNQRIFPQGQLRADRVLSLTKHIHQRMATEVRSSIGGHGVFDQSGMPEYSLREGKSPKVCLDDPYYVNVSIEGRKGCRLDLLPCCSERQVTVSI
jgi:hypothetical protein